MNRKDFARGAPMIRNHVARHALSSPERLLASCRWRRATLTACPPLALRTGSGWLLARDLAAADPAPDVGDMAGIAALPKDERIASPAFAPQWDPL